MEELKTLVARARRGELDAYGEIVQRFQDMAVGYAYSVLGDAHLAEDAAQEAFLQAYLDLEKLSELAAFPGWFRRIVFKHCDRIRRKRHTYTVSLEEDRLHAPDKNPAELLEEQDTRDRLNEAIRNLPEPDRAATTLFYISEFTQREIAAFLEVPETTINNRLHAARKRLKKELVQMTQENLQEQRPSRDNAFAGNVQDYLESLKIFHNKLVDPLTALFSKSLDVEVKVEIVFVNHTTALNVVQEFRNPCCTYSFLPQPTENRILIDIGMELAGALVGRRSATGDAIRAVDLSMLTPEEIGHLNQLAIPMLKGLVGTWEGVLHIEISQVELECNPIYMIAHPQYRCIGPEDPIFHVLIEVKWDDHSSQLNLCYPSTSLAAVLARLQQA